MVPGVDLDTITQGHALVQDDVRVQDHVAADLAVGTHDDAGMNRAAITDDRSHPQCMPEDRSPRRSPRRAVGGDKRPFMDAGPARPNHSR